MDKERNGIMKELTMPKEVYLEEFDVHIRPYLLAEEVASIGDLILQADNYIEKELTLMLNVIVCCTDVTEDEARELDLDAVKSSGLWGCLLKEIVNIVDVLDYVDYAENAQVAVAKFLNITLPNLVDRYIDRLPKEEEWGEVIDKLPKSLNDILELAKQDGNADIIRGAMKMGEVSEAGDE